MKDKITKSNSLFHCSKGAFNQDVRKKPTNLNLPRLFSWEVIFDKK